MSIINAKNDITSCILGAKGSGKTVLLASMANKMAGPLVLFDILGVLNPKAPYRTAIVPGVYFNNPGSFLSYFRAGKITNQKCVINLSETDNLIDTIDSICLEIMNKKTKIAVLSDEVADIIGQNAKGSGEFVKLVKNGRNYGVRPVIFATQRPQSVSKSVFDLCDTFYISKQKAPRTIDYILDILDLKGSKDMGAKIRGLQQRQFLKYDDEIKIYTVPEYKYANKQ
jgi:hypothetical protein